MPAKVAGDVARVIPELIENKFNLFFCGNIENLYHYYLKIFHAKFIWYL